MTKQTKQRTHKKYFADKFYEVIKSLGLSYRTTGIQKGFCYYYMFRSLTKQQETIIINSHPKKELVRIEGGVVMFKYN